ncbi:MAG: CoA transferase, partial [bacterium]
MKQPLAGIRVIDISWAVAGPFCAMFLGDMGAEVIKVERPDGGDEIRGWGRPFIDGEAAWYLAVNRNKKSLTLNLKSEKGKDILFRLIEKSDVFVESFNPSALERIGLIYEEVKKYNPKIIYCAVSGFGQTGPLKDRPGYDLIVQGMGGIMSVTGEKGGKPQRVGTSSSDIVAGMIAAFCAASALYGREKNGKGQFIDVALLDGQIALMSPRIMSYLISGEIPRPMGSTDSPITIYQPMPTADDDIIIGTGNDQMWARFSKAVGLEYMIDDPRFATNEARSVNKEELMPILENELRKKPAKYWIEKLTENGVPCGPINFLNQVVKEPQVLARNMIAEVEHPKFGRIKLPGIPWWLDGESVEIKNHPPILGEHTEEILSTILGLSENEIKDLKEKKAI